MSERAKKSLPKGGLNWLVLLVLLVVSTAFMLHFYGPILLNPNDYMFSQTGDGIKNYFTYAYHIKYDASATEFAGMNYPYGEHILYTDCHPLLANTLRWLSRRMPYFQTHSLGILNTLMLLSIFCTFWIVYALLREYKLRPWLAMFFTLSITALAPQLFRMDGHLAMSYSMAIPLAWLLLKKYLNKRNWILLATFFLFNVIWLFTHAYLGIIVLFFATSLALSHLVYQNKGQSITQIGMLLLAIVVPVLIFYSYAKLTDHHVGRTDNPSGFFLYNAEPDDVFIPHEAPFRVYIDKLFPGKISLEWEAWGHIGLANTLLTLSLLLFMIWSVFVGKFKKFYQWVFDHADLNRALVAGLVVLLFAFGIPFKQFPVLLDWFPVVKQFRATGRFVWPFYFVFTVGAAYLFQKIVDQLLHSYKWLLIPGILLVLGSLYWEGWMYHQIMGNRLQERKNLFLTEHLDADLTHFIDHVDVSKYQGLICLPFFYVGSESYSRPRQEEAVRNAILFSNFTGLPNLGANLTRTGIEESKRIVQLVSPGYYQKPIENELPNNKPFLILKTGEELTLNERQILTRADTLMQKGNLTLLSISKDDLFSDTRKEVWEQFNLIQDSLKQHQGFLLSGSDKFLYYQDFESNRSDTASRGKGAYVGVKEGLNIYAEFPSQTFEKGKTYQLSMWMFNGEQDALNLWFPLAVQEYKGGDEEWKSTIVLPDQAETINGNWSLVECRFTIENPNQKVRVVSVGKKRSKASLHADDLLIKEEGVDVYRIEDNGYLFYNNHQLKPVIIH